MRRLDRGAVAAPTDIVDRGRFAVLKDSEGATFGICEPGEQLSFGVYDVPTTWCGFELMSRDPRKAKAFYRSVFGWATDSHPFGPSSYVEWQLRGESFSGMVQMSDAFPKDSRMNGCTALRCSRRS